MIKRRDPNEVRAALRAFMDSRKLTIKPWCERASVSPNTLYNFFANHSQSLSLPTLEKLARSENVSIDEMIGEHEFRRTQQIKVVGAVQAGVFKESMAYDLDHQHTIAVPLEAPKGARIFALDVVGPSMNQVFPDGAIVIVCSIHDYPLELENGERVIVEHRRSDGQVEATCKELRFDDSSETAWLWPRSNDPAFQQPVKIDWPHEDRNEDDGSIEIIGVVIGHYVPNKPLFLNAG